MLHEKQVQFSDSDSDFWFTRIFSDGDTWLTVYCNRNRQPIRFTYVQGMRTDIRACLQWSPDRGLRFHKIDSGESSPLTNRSPVATGTLPFDKSAFLSAFKQESQEIDPLIRQWVLDRIDEK